MKNKLLLILGALLLAGCSTGPVVEEDPAVIKAREEAASLEHLETLESLREIPKTQEFYFGAAVDYYDLGKAPYQKILQDHFNTIVAGNAMKFSYMQPQPGVFKFNSADRVANFAKDNDMELRGHVFIWHAEYQVPNWVKSAPPEDLVGIAEDHIEGVMNHYAGQVYAWDVANEIILDDGSGFRNRQEGSSIWAADKEDDSVFKAAFYKADAMRKALDDDVKLYLCDYSNETKGHKKADKFYEVVEGWVAEGVPIDGVAFQLHLMEKYNPDYKNIRANIDRFQALGLDVQFTEIDVRIELDANGKASAEQLARQAEIYRTLMEILMEKNLDTYVIWGVSDANSWVPNTFSGYGAPLIFDEKFMAKPAYFELRDYLKN